MSGHVFARPSKQIHAESDLPAFRTSIAYQSLVHFLASMCDAVCGRPVSVLAPTEAPPAVAAMLRLLDEVDSWIAEIPPVSQPTRFGNKAFRTFHARLSERATGLLRELIRSSAAGVAACSSLAPAAVAPEEELAPYLADSFGNSVRIDFGTGHEAAFLALLCALSTIGLFESSLDLQYVGLAVFPRYIALMRHLQSTYMLEPAGSHGVWGLDDYHFVPFILGAAQLCGHEDMYPPDCIHQAETVARLRGEYLYMECIDTILRVKRGPFGEHSPMLNDIAALSSWDRIEKGLVKMYKAEVLGKFPVIQHFWFGSLLSFARAGLHQAPV